MQQMFRLKGFVSQFQSASTDPPVEEVSPDHSALDWVLPDKLAVGCLPRAQDAQLLARAGIKTILSLCAEAEGSLPTEITQNFRCLRYILPDSHYMFDLRVSQLGKVVEMMHESIENHQPVYVHCLEGVERSPTVCIAYLCTHYDLELWEAAACLRQAHPPSMPTNAQIHVIRELIDPPSETSQVTSTSILDIAKADGSWP